MANRQSFEVTVLTPEREAFRGKVYMLKAQAVDGGITVLGRHAPLLTVLAPCVITLNTAEAPGTTERFAISGGLLRVTPHVVQVLVEAAERSCEIDAHRAEVARTNRQQPGRL